MGIVIYKKHHPTHTEIKRLYMLYRFKWWKGTVYFRMVVYTQYILNDNF